MDIDRCRHIIAFEWMTKGSPRMTVEQRCTWRTSSYRHPLKHGYWSIGHIVAFEGMIKGSQFTKRSKDVLKDIFMPSSFEIWISIDVGIQLQLNEYQKDAHYQDWWWNKDVREEHFHIIILWNMAIDWGGHTIEWEWMVKKGTPPRLVVEQCCIWRIIPYCHPLKYGYRKMLSHNYI